MVEVEPGQALSTRKLLLETAKHNVLTAHSAKEGVHMLRRFPAVDAIAIDASLEDMSCERMAKQMRDIKPKVPIVALSPRIGNKCDWADRTISSHDPHQLLQLLEEFGGRTAI